MPVITKTRAETLAEVARLYHQAGITLAWLREQTAPDAKYAAMIEEIAPYLAPLEKDK